MIHKLLFFRGGKYLRSHALVDAVVQFVVPNLTGGPRFVLDALLAGLVGSQWFGTGRDTLFADGSHLIDWSVVFVRLIYVRGSVGRNKFMAVVREQ